MLCWQWHPGITGNPSFGLLKKCTGMAKCHLCHSSLLAKAAVGALNSANPSLGFSVQGVLRVMPVNFPVMAASSSLVFEQECGPKRSSHSMRAIRVRPSFDAISSREPGKNLAVQTVCAASVKGAPG
jgi:hypothetical protein